MSNSPFPGMDPYLEGELWQEFHDTLTHQIRGQLLAALPAHYVALALQTAVDTAFDLVGYHRLLNYNQLPPSPPLDAETAAWVERQRAAAGEQSPP